MHILLVPDKFKGSLTAKEVIRALQKGISRVSSEFKTSQFVLSDGGDGFLEAVAQYRDLEEVWVKTVDPLGRELEAPYLFNEKRATAYIELSKASGMELLKITERDALRTSTLGTGIQIKNAIDRGAKHIYIGLGGSATNDAGLGIAQALGFVFKDGTQKEVSPQGGNLNSIKTIERGTIVTEVEKVSFYAINDVNNPLYGPSGAAYVYASQKGAGPLEIAQLDQGLKDIAALFLREMKTDYGHLPGAGAAGGTAYGLKTCFDAQFISGTKFLIYLAGIEALLKKESIAIIITGEGKIDGQTKNGKLVKGMVNLARKHHIPIAAICGKLDLNGKGVAELGLDHVLALQDGTHSDAYCMTHASELIEDRVAHFLEEGYPRINKKD